MFSLLLDTRKWNTDMQIKGELPAPRSFHSTTAVGNRVVITGGRAQDNTHLADIHVFDAGHHCAVCLIFVLKCLVDEYLLSLEHLFATLSV